MILGLMWTLILHFQILESSEQKPGKKEGAKEQLINWLKEYLAVSEILVCNDDIRIGIQYQFHKLP